VILRHYIDRERGDLFMALGRYNGSRGKPQYPNAVFGAGKAWAFSALPPFEATPDPSRPADRVPGGPN
jgi:soluble lytic murein transglycosylase-like protein